MKVVKLEWSAGEAGELSAVVYVERLEAAHAALDRLDNSVGAIAHHTLSGWRGRKDSLCAEDVERADRVVGVMVRLVSLARARIKGTPVAARLAPRLEQIERKASGWLERIRAPDGPNAREAAKLGTRMLAEGDGLLKHLGNILVRELAAVKGEASPATIPITGARKSPGRPPNPKHHEWYEEIRRSVSYLGSWKKAVEAFSRERGVKYTVAQVRKWGQRARQRDREQLKQAG